MSKSTTKKAAASKTAKAPQAMDESVRELPVGEPMDNNRRVCRAIKTLVAEVADLYPGVPYEVSNYNGRNTALDVSFDATALDNDEAITFIQLLGLVETDERVAEVVTDDNQVLISMLNSPRTYDLTGPFGLDDAYSILTSGEEGGSL